MKSRRGFVSNSSSSSFIVALPAWFPSDPEGVQRFLTGAHYVGFSSMAYSYGGERLPEEQVFTRIASKLSEAPALTRAQVRKHISPEGLYELARLNKYLEVGAHSWRGLTEEQHTAMGCSYKRLNKAAIAYFYRQATILYGDSFVVKEVSFGDRGDSCILPLDYIIENGNQFQFIPHIRECNR